jgi:DNA adenine methylase
VESPVSARNTGRPLLKWAGGKRQLLPALRPFFPRQYRRYIEPFFGSGAVFFDLYSSGALAGKRAWLVDDNADLIGCYRMLADRTDEVLTALRGLAAGHLAGGDAFYYQVRDERFNPTRAAGGPDAAYTPELAAMLIYLNRTGFNGLFRLNRRGAFNVPVGRYTNPSICDEPHLRVVAEALRSRSIKLQRGSFDVALAEAGAGDFIYCDPPYAPLSKTACFANYTASGFTPADQLRLQQSLVAAARRGASIVLSNSAAPEIEHLYARPEASRARLRIERVKARRAINSRADARGVIDELVITNTPPLDMRPRMLKVPAQVKEPQRRRA